MAFDGTADGGSDVEVEDETEAVALCVTAVLCVMDLTPWEVPKPAMNELAVGATGVAAGKGCGARDGWTPTEEKLELNEPNVPNAGAGTGGPPLPTPNDAVCGARGVLLTSRKDPVGKPRVGVGCAALDSPKPNAGWGAAPKPDANENVVDATGAVPGAGEGGLDGGFARAACVRP